MNKKIIGLIVLILVFGLTWFLVGGNIGGDDGRPQEVVAVFACEDDKMITATLDLVEESVNLVLSDGRIINLPRVESESGAKYTNNDESMVFWSHGEEAFIEQEGEVAYSNCLMEIDLKNF